MPSQSPCGGRRRPGVQRTDLRSRRHGAGHLALTAPPAIARLAPAGRDRLCPDAAIDARAPLAKPVPPHTAPGLA